MPDFIPRAHNKALAWSIPFTQQINADPERFGISSKDAALLVSTQAEFAAKLQLAQAGATNSSSSKVALRMARAEFQRVARQLAGWVRATLQQDRVIMSELGLTMGPGRLAPRRKIGLPTAPAKVIVLDVNGASVSIRLFNPDAPSRRGMSPDIGSANIFTYVGIDYPANLRDWRMHRTTTRCDTTLDFGSQNPPGTKIWICAQWTNPRRQAGPTGAPVYAYLNYPSPIRAAA